MWGVTLGKGTDRMAWFALMLDGGAAVIARPKALDLVEEYYSTDDTDELMRRYQECFDSIQPDGTVEWQKIAAQYNVTVADIQHFFADFMDPDVFVQGCVEAMRKAYDRRLPLKYIPELSDHMYVTHTVQDDCVAIHLFAPQAVENASFPADYVNEVVDTAARAMERPA